jgi:hypothetical protein
MSVSVSSTPTPLGKTGETPLNAALSGIILPFDECALEQGF